MLNVLFDGWFNGVLGWTSWVIGPTHQWSPKRCHLEACGDVEISLTGSLAWTSPGTKRNAVSSLCVQFCNQRKASITIKCLSVVGGARFRLSGCSGQVWNEMVGGLTLACSVKSVALAKDKKLSLHCPLLLYATTPPNGCSGTVSYFATQSARSVRSRTLGASERSSLGYDRRIRLRRMSSMHCY